MKTRRPHVLSTAAAVLLISSSAAFAQVGFWGGDGVGQDWTNSANWVSGNIAGQNNFGGALTSSSNNWAFFRLPGNSADPVVIDHGRTVQGFSIYGLEATPLSRSYTFVSDDGAGGLGTVYIRKPGSNDSGIQLKDFATGPLTQIFNVNVHLVPTSTTGRGDFAFYSHLVGGSIVINGDVTSSPTSGRWELDLTGQSTALNQINGSISDGSANAGLHLIKSLGGTWVLSGTNTYRGGTTLNAGTLHVNNASALGTGAVAINGGALANSSGAAIKLSTNNAINIGGAVTFDGEGTLHLGDGATNLGNAASRTITVSNAAGVLALGGTISKHETPASTGIVKAGAGTLVIDGAASYNGTTNVNAGTLLIDGSHTGAGAYAVASGATLGGAGVIETAGNSGITFAAGSKLSPGGQFEVNLGSGVFDLSVAVAGSNTGALVFTLGGSASSDRLAVTNASTGLNIGAGALDLGDFNFTAATGFGEGQYVLLSTLGGISGTLGAQLTGDFEGYHVTLGLDGAQRNLVLDVQAAIPEPSTVALLVLTSLGLAWRRFRS